MAKLKLSGSHIAFTGKIKGYTKSSLGNFIRAAGGSVASSPSSGVTAFLVGERAADKKVDKARALGLTIIEGDFVYELLDKGELELDSMITVRSLDELIAEARALFDGAPDHETWKQLAALVDECEPAQVEDFITYLRPQLDKWPRSVGGPIKHRTHDFRTGIFSHAAGELRFFPDAWLAGLANGQRHPKHSLCTSLTFTFVALNNSMGIKVLENPDIQQIRTLDIGTPMSVNIKKKTFYKALAKCPNVANVETLCLTESPEGALDPLLDATSMPALRAIFLDPYLGMLRSLDKGAALFFGPWADQLETVGVSDPVQLEALAARIDDLPSLHTLALSTHVRTKPETFASIAQHLSTALAPIRNLILGITSIDSYSELTGLGIVLDAIDSELDLLDMRECRYTKLEGEAGVAFAREHFIDTGLGARVGELILSELVGAQVVAYLRENGVNVTSPVEASAGDIVDHVFVEDVAPGEAERVAARQVHVTDAMMFSAPGYDAWEVLTGVVDGLERQLDASEFEAAISTLEEYLASWPDVVRECPERWLGEYFREQPSPKIRLPRTFKYHGSYAYPKELARWMERFSQNKAVEQFTRIQIGHPGKQKYFLNAVASLFEAIKPESYSIYWGGSAEIKKVSDHLRGLGLLPEENPPPANVSSVAWSSDNSALELREVCLEVSSQEQLQEVFDRADMDHVVSLDLKLSFPYPEYDGHDWSGLTARVASWRRLRYLNLSINDRFPSSCFGALATWLSRARPVHVGPRFVSMSPSETPVLELARAGVYARAWGSSVELPNTIDAASVSEVLSNEDFNVGAIELMYGSCSVPDTADLPEMMHEELAARLQSLKWPVSVADLGQVEALCQSLPTMTLWAPISSRFRTKAGREPLFKGLASAPTSSRLSQVRFVSMSDPADKIAAAELKILEKGEGARGGALAPTKL